MLYLSKALCLIYECEQVEMFTQPESPVAALCDPAPLKFKTYSWGWNRKAFIKAEEASIKKRTLNPIYMLGNKCVNGTCLSWRSGGADESWERAVLAHSGRGLNPSLAILTSQSQPSWRRLCWRKAGGERNARKGELWVHRELCLSTSVGWRHTKADSPPCTNAKVRLWGVKSGG